MCNNPHTVTVKRSNYHQTYDQFVKLSHSLPLSSDDLAFRVSPFLRIDAPCGKCAECLRKKQKCVEIRFLRESQVNPLMHFVTLTYRPDKVPMSMTLWYVDKESGESYLVRKPTVLAPRFNKTELNSSVDVTRKALIRSMRTTSNPNGVDYLEKIIFSDSQFDYVARATPSLCRKDVQLWLKRCRVRYERKYGEKVAEFRYYLVGEYGFNTNRPHYHLAFFGLPQRQLDFFLEHWKDCFGFVKSEKVYARNRDGSNAFLLVGKYVAKYMTKMDSLEYDGVVQGYAEKPRVMSSKSFGVGKVSDSLRAYYLGYRFFGAYDVETLRFKDGTRLSQDQVNYLSQYIAEHLFFDVDGFLYPIPGLIRKRLFGIYKTKIVKNEIKEYFDGFSPIYHLAMVYARGVYMDLFERKYRQGVVDPSAEGFSETVIAVGALLSSAARYQDEAFKKAALASLQQSKV